MCANLGLIIYGGNATDAYDHSRAPNDLYLTIDDAYADWYENKYEIKLNRRHILPVRHALQ